MSDLILRPGRPADVPQLVPMAGSADRARWRVQAAGSGGEALVVAERDGVPVGCVSVRWEAECDPPHPWLYGLHVLPDVRRHGVGGLLVRAAETTASLHGASAVSLDVDRDEENLIAYYQRLGYERVGPHEHRWRAVDPTTGEVTAEGLADTWVMRHQLGGDPRP